MKAKLNYFYIFIITLLISLLVFGYLLNKRSSASKKNEISNILQQLKTRNLQISKIQKNLFKNGKNINDLINEKKINFKKVFENKEFANFKEYSTSKYTTNDILFNGNRGAIGTGFIDFYNNDQNLFLVTYDGIFAYARMNNLQNFEKINSNINSLIQYEKFYFHDQYGIKDILIDEKTLYVSYIGKRKDNCYDLKIISAKLNEEYLNFQIFYETSSCVDVNNSHGFYPAQGAGGRIIKLDNSNLLFTTGDFRNRPLAQDLVSDFGKILKINTQNKKSDVISIGHRNPQGLYYSKKFNFIISTEHGPKGGDEVNINLKPFKKIKNFGWPVSSYGEHYYKAYSKKILQEAPLNKSHKKYGFVEPIKYFVPSIGISQIIPLNKDETKFLIGAMGNEIKDQDLGLHLILLNEKRQKVIEHNYTLLNERVRDIIVSKDKKTVIIFLETSSSLLILKRI
jgi:hypothetical protein